MHTHSNLTDGKTKVLSNLAIEEIQGPDQDLKPMSLPRGSILPGSIQGPPLYVLRPWDCRFPSLGRSGLEMLRWPDCGAVTLVPCNSYCKQRHRRRHKSSCKSLWPHSPECVVWWLMKKKKKTHLPWHFLLRRRKTFLLSFWNHYLSPLMRSA